MSATGRRATLRHVPALDGLRGLAVVAVIAFHADLSWARGGYLGVSAFFTLSGFLITSLLLGEWERTGTVSLRGFWSRRFRRLLPAALVLIATVVALSPWLADSGQLADLPGDAVAGLGYVANWRFVFDARSYADLFTGPSPLQHLWSLAIEEQFYVVFPVLAVGLLRAGRGRRTVLAVAIGVLTVASAAWALHLGMTPSGAERAYYDTGARALEVLVGALLAVAIAGRTEALRHPRLVAGAGALALPAVGLSWAFVPQDSALLQRGGLLLHALAMAAVLAAAHVPGPVRSFGSLRPLRQAGAVSYGLYLVHWPVFVWLDADRTGLDGPVLLGLQLTITVALTSVSYHLVEQPIRVGGRFAGARGAVIAGACAAVVALGAPIIARTATPSDGIVLALGDLPAAQTAGVAGAMTDAAVESDPDDVPRFRHALAPVEAVDEVLLVGDSVMAQSLQHMVTAFDTRDVRVTYAGGPGTGPLSPQGSWAEQIDSWISTRDFDVVVIEACCNYTMRTDEHYVDESGQSVAPGSAGVLPAWEREMRDLIRRAGAGGARVDLVRFAPVRSSGWYGPIEEHVQSVNVLYDDLAAEFDLGIIDWGPVLAPDGAFTWDVAGDDGVIRRVRLEDGVHLTADGSRLISDATADAVLGARRR